MSCESAPGSTLKDSSIGPGVTGKLESLYTIRLHSYLSRGCTTPRVLENIKNSIQKEEEGDDLTYDELDGFEELSSEIQDKIKIALEKGHIEDEEWNGVSPIEPGTHFQCIDNRLAGCYAQPPRYERHVSPEASS